MSSSAFNRRGALRIAALRGVPMNQEAESRSIGRVPMSRARLAVSLMTMLGVILIVAACGGGSSGESDSASGIVQSGDLDAPAQEAPSPATSEGEQAAADSGDADSVPGDADPEEIAPEDVFLMFAQCLRDEGLDVSDPDFSSGRGPGGILRDIDRQDAEVQAAMEVCRPLIQNSRPELTSEEQSERQDAQLAFTACLRDQGLDVADPDFNGGGGGGFLRGSDIDLQDPEVQAAIETCRDEVPNFGGRGGPGGGGQG
jgi:hypothetical protein